MTLFSRCFILPIAAIVICGVVGGCTTTPPESIRHAASAEALRQEVLASVPTIASAPEGWVSEGLEPASSARGEQGVMVTSDAPTALASLDVSLDVQSQTQYWFWAHGAEVTATGLQPGESARVSLRLASGEQRSWAPVTADENGSVVTRVRYLDVDPDNLRPDAGIARITVTSDSAAVGSALLEVTRDAGEVLQVETDPESITQDEFLDNSIRIRVSGFEPLDKVFFNLGFPDTTMFSVGTTEGLHADENGMFEYTLQSADANAPVGSWLLSFQSDGDLQGAGSFEVLNGRSRVQDKTLTLDHNKVSTAAFTTAPGLRFALSGFAPFESYELRITTSRGATFPVGLGRVDGEGNAASSVNGPAAAPSGQYTLTARSTITGNYASAPFTVDDSNRDASAPSVTVVPGTISATALTDTGVDLAGSGFAPDVSLRISLRDRDWRRSALFNGADLYVTTAADGTFVTSLRTLERIVPGGYTIWVSALGGIESYDLRYPLQVFASETPAATTPVESPAPIRPVMPMATPRKYVTPGKSEPAPDESSTPPASSTPAPPTEVTPDLPPLGGFDGNTIPVPSPVTR